MQQEYSMQLPNPQYHSKSVGSGNLYSSPHRWLRFDIVLRDNPPPVEEIYKQFREFCGQIRPPLQTAEINQILVKRISAFELHIYMALSNATAFEQPPGSSNIISTISHSWVDHVDPEVSEIEITQIFGDYCPMHPVLGYQLPDQQHPNMDANFHPGGPGSGSSGLQGPLYQPQPYQPHSYPGNVVPPPGQMFQPVKPSGLEFDPDVGYETPGYYPPQSHPPMGYDYPYPYSLPYPYPYPSYHYPPTTYHHNPHYPQPQFPALEVEHKRAALGDFTYHTTKKLHVAESHFSEVPVSQTHSHSQPQPQQQLTPQSQVQAQAFPGQGFQSMPSPSSFPKSNINQRHNLPVHDQSGFPSRPHSTTGAVEHQSQTSLLNPQQSSTGAPVLQSASTQIATASSIDIERVVQDLALKSTALSLEEMKKTQITFIEKMSNHQEEFMKVIQKNQKEVMLMQTEAQKFTQQGLDSMMKMQTENQSFTQVLMNQVLAFGTGFMETIKQLQSQNRSVPAIEVGSFQGLPNGVYENSLSRDGKDFIPIENTPSVRKPVHTEKTSPVPQKTEVSSKLSNKVPETDFAKNPPRLSQATQDDEDEGEGEMNQENERTNHRMLIEEEYKEENDPNPSHSAPVEQPKTPQGEADEENKKENEQGKNGPNRNPGKRPLKSSTNHTMDVPLDNPMSASASTRTTRQSQRNFDEALLSQGHELPQSQTISTQPQKTAFINLAQKTGIDLLGLPGFWNLFPCKDDLQRELPRDLSEAARISMIDFQNAFLESAVMKTAMHVLIMGNMRDPLAPGPSTGPEKKRISSGSHVIEIYGKPDRSFDDVLADLQVKRLIFVFTEKEKEKDKEKSKVKSKALGFYLCLRDNENPSEFPTRFWVSPFKSQPPELPSRYFPKKEKKLAEELQEKAPKKSRKPKKSTHQSQEEIQPRAVICGEESPQIKILQALFRAVSANHSEDLIKEVVTGVVHHRRWKPEGDPGKDLLTGQPLSFNDGVSENLLPWCIAEALRKEKTNKIFDSEEVQRARSVLTRPEAAPQMKNALKSCNFSCKNT